MRFVACLLFYIVPATSAYANAWTQEEGKGEAILTARYYHTSSYFDETGERVPMNAYSKHEITPYVEYGLYDGFTIGANLSLQHAVQFGGPGAPNQQSWAMSDSELFARARLWEGNGFIVSAEPMVKIPSPDGANKSPKIGGSNPDVGLRFLGGYSFNWLGHHHFVEAGAGMRHRFGTPHDQIQLNASTGFSLTSRLMIMPQISATIRSEQPTVPLFTQAPSDDYNLTQFQLSAIYEWDETTSLQAGAFSHAAGRNVGNGDGLIFSVWKKF